MTKKQQNERDKNSRQYNHRRYGYGNSEDKLDYGTQKIKKPSQKPSFEFLEFPQLAVFAFSPCLINAYFQLSAFSADDASVVLLQPGKEENKIFIRKSEKKKGTWCND